MIIIDTDISNPIIYLWFFSYVIILCCYFGKRRGVCGKKSFCDVVLKSNRTTSFKSSHFTFTLSLIALTKYKFVMVGFYIITRIDSYWGK